MARQSKIKFSKVHKPIHPSRISIRPDTYINLQVTSMYVYVLGLVTPGTELDLAQKRGDVKLIIETMKRCKSTWLNEETNKFMMHQAFG